MDDLVGTGALPQKRGRRTVWLILGGGLLLMLLVGAAFVGGQLLAQQPLGTGDNPITVPGLGVQLTHLEELPDEEPNVVGAFVRLDGNSLFVGTFTGNAPIAIKWGPDGVPDVDYDGPEVEVVITHETEIYEERIRFQEDGVEQTLKLGSLGDIAERCTTLEVWGERRGDRVTARVLVYRSISMDRALVQP